MSRKKQLKLHLACGTNAVKGWDNIDILKGKGIKYHDLTKPLPYQDGTVDMIFHEHFIEHLPKAQGEAFLQECLRVLKPGGAMRIGWPDTAKAVRAYLTRNKKYFDYISKHVDAGMKFRTWDELLVDFFYSWGHRYGYTRKHLKRLLTTLGFKKAKYKKFKQSDYGFDIDFRNDPATTYIEVIK
ncbi:MAG TPA: methyltransferase domain-containing protein [Candidatus Saccharimonadales bacterium]|nr:methyltransferase domain-containing protein [Candidatus Saccharimonadales bacterium]